MNKARKIARVLLALAVLVLLIRMVGARAIVDSLFSLEASAVAGLFLLLLADSLIRAANWRSLVLALQHDVAPAALSRRVVWYSYLTGGFFGSVLPSSLGLDVARIAVLGRRAGVGYAASGAGLVLLNVLALWTLNLMAVVGSVAWLLAGGPSYLVPLLLASTGISVLLPGLVLAGPHLRARLLPRLPRRLQSAVEAMVALAARPDVLLRAAAVTAFNHLITIACVALVLHSIAVPDGTLELFVLVPMATMFRLLPLSVSGFGAEQGVFVFLLSQVGVGAADALSISLVLAVANVVFNATGGLLYLAREGTRARPLASPVVEPAAAVPVTSNR